MPFSSAQLKNGAKRAIRFSKPNVISVGAVYCILGIVLSLLSSQLINSGVTVSRYEQFMTYAEAEDVERAMAVFTQMLPSGSAVIIYLLLGASSLIVSVGFTIFLMRTVRGDNPTYGNLLDGFGFIGRILLLDILTAVFVFLWSLLFVIPGIVASYRYSMAVYIMIDHPEYSVMTCLRESKRMMRGHKGERFLLDLSFLGWQILVSLSAVPYLWFLSGLQVWTVPYMSMTFVIYYEILRQGGTLPVFPDPASRPGGGFMP